MTAGAITTRGAGTATGGAGTATSRPGVTGAADPDRFTGATIRLFQVDVLVVYVPCHVVGDRTLAPMVVAAFHARFDRTIVLAAQDRRGVPTYFGPAPIATVLSRIPFDALAWRRYRYRKPQPMMLPIPTDPLPEDRESNSRGWSAWQSDRPGEHRDPVVARSDARRTRTLIPDREQAETRR